MKAFLSPLSQEEEKECLQKLKQGDLKAKEALILHNMRLVAHVAKKYQNDEDEIEDLISIGTIGLLKAVSTFDYNYGNRFATYAIRCIENELLMHFRKSKRLKMEVSLFEPIGTDKEGKQIHLMEVLLVDEVDVAKQMEIRRDIALVMQHLEKLLSPREAMIIKMRYGLCGEKELTQREIAQKMGISRSYVSRIEKKALEKLKNMLLQA
ncbi:MAG: RNA polymerase sporulation sigma factor SigK [Agathobacter sp.]|nr:RNA polymerase sporulation sigma factor SigK [Agathobacter sp.]